MFKRKLRTPINRPKPKGLYAWNCLHAGSFLLYVESLKDCHKFLFLPGPSEYYLTFEEFSSSVHSNMLEFVEALPDDIFEESIKLSLHCPPSPSKVIAHENHKNEKGRAVPKEDSNS